MYGTKTTTNQKFVENETIVKNESENLIENSNSKKAKPILTKAKRISYRFIIKNKLSRSIYKNIDNSFDNLDRGNNNNIYEGDHVGNQEGVHVGNQEGNQDNTTGDIENKKYECNNTNHLNRFATDKIIQVFNMNINNSCIEYCLKNIEALNTNLDCLINDMIILMESNCTTKNEDFDNSKFNEIINKGIANVYNRLVNLKID